MTVIARRYFDLSRNEAEEQFLDVRPRDYLFIMKRVAYFHWSQKDYTSADRIFALISQQCQRLNPRISSDDQKCITDTEAEYRSLRDRHPISPTYHWLDLGIR